VKECWEFVEGGPGAAVVATPESAELDDGGGVTGEYGGGA